MADPAGYDDDADDEPADVDGRPWLERLGEVAPPRRPWLVPLATLLAGVGCAAVAGAGTGGRGVASGLVAALLVLAFFTTTRLPMVVAGGSTGLGLVVLLTNYVFRLLAASVLLLALSRAGWVDRRAVGVSLIVCAVVRVNAQVLLVRAVSRT